MGETRRLAAVGGVSCLAETRRSASLTAFFSLGFSVARPVLGLICARGAMSLTVASLIGGFFLPQYLYSVFSLGHSERFRVCEDHIPVILHSACVYSLAAVNNQRNSQSNAWEGRSEICRFCGQIPFLPRN
jgi:hypothetical protein